MLAPGARGMPFLGAQQGCGCRMCSPAPPAPAPLANLAPPRLPALPSAATPRRSCSSRGGSRAPAMYSPLEWSCELRLRPAGRRATGHGLGQVEGPPLPASCWALLPTALEWLWVLPAQPSWPSPCLRPCADCRWEMVSGQRPFKGMAPMQVGAPRCLPPSLLCLLWPVPCTCRRRHELTRLATASLQLLLTWPAPPVLPPGQQPTSDRPVQPACARWHSPAGPLLTGSAT